MAKTNTKVPSESNKYHYIDREATNVIKGVALIFMFIHHFFTIPRFYINSISYPDLEGFAQLFNEPFKICVSLFAFLTGCFYVFAEKKDLRYSLRKSTDVWIIYLVYFLLLLIPTFALGCWNGSAVSLVLEAFGIRQSVMTFCWYVIFYVISMLLLPLFHIAAKKHIMAAVLCGIVVPIGITSLMSGNIHIPNRDIEKVIFNFFNWFPCIASGYIFAQYGLFEKGFDPLFKRFIKYKAIRAVIAILLMSAAFFGRYYTYQIVFNVSIFTVSFSLDFLLAPIFIYGLINIIELIPRKKALLPISIIGKYSLGMWFFHCLFFSRCKEYTQPLLYFPKIPILVLIWGLLICLGVSFALTKAIAPLLRWKNKRLLKNK